MKNFGFLEMALVLLTVIVVLAIVALISSLAYPEAAESIIRDLRRGTLDSESPVIGAIIKFGQRVGDGYNYRIEPAFENLGRYFSGGPPKKTDVKAGKRRQAKFGVKDCINCHKDLFDNRGLGNIYVDHRLHEALEIQCGQCHGDTRHPKPKHVAEAVCLDCHRRQGATQECQSCHPAGSLADESVIGKDVLNEFYAYRTASSKSLMPLNFEQPPGHWLKGEDNPPCQQCHSVPEFCNQCHLVLHNQIANWLDVHGPRLLRQEYVMNACWTCHNANWCAATCHSNPANRQRRSSFLQLPIVPLENYIR